MKGKTALIVGATGLVGNELIKRLLDAEEYTKVISMVRNSTGHVHPKLEERIVNFDRLEEWSNDFTVDDVFCCLGTTIKKAKTKECMYKVDVDYPVSIAKLAFKNGAKHFLVISSMNANPTSSIWYSRMKGELEQKLMSIPYKSLSILRPSLLLGERNEFRLGEKVAGAVAEKIPFLFKGPLKKYQAIQAKTVANAMYKIAQQENQGVTVYSSEELENIGRY